MFREKHNPDATAGPSIAPRVVLFCFVAAFAVFGCSLLLQWLIYDDWLHQTGPVRIVGSCVAAILTLLALFQWQQSVHERQERMLRRFQTIARMNDQIRNALQIIECTTYIADPQAAEHVRQAVAQIDDALQGVVAEAQPDPDSAKRRSASATHGTGKIA
jgi:Flp pilus assembly protein TadB